MANYFEACFKKVIELEGDYSDDKDDRGGATRWGVTEVEARNHGYHGDMKDFPLESARSIYLSDYFMAMRLEGCLTESKCVAIFQAGVNFGVRPVAQRAQRAAGLPLEKCDGILGTTSWTAINLMPDSVFLPRFTKLLMQRYVGIVKKNPTQMVFLSGWTNRVFTILGVDRDYNY